MAKSNPNFCRFYREKVCKGLDKLVDQATDGGCPSFAVSMTPNGGLIVHDSTGIFKAFVSDHLREFTEVFCEAEEKRSATSEESSTAVPNNTVILPLPEVRWSQLTNEKMRQLIPCYTKLLTGRGQPGWGKPGMQPSWWPEDRYPWSTIDPKSGVFKKPEGSGYSKEEWQFTLQCVVRAAIVESGFEPDSFYRDGQPKRLHRPDSPDRSRGLDSPGSEDPLDTSSPAGSGGLPDSSLDTFSPAGLPDSPLDTSSPAGSGGLPDSPTSSPAGSDGLPVTPTGRSRQPQRELGNRTLEMQRQPQVNEDIHARRGKKRQADFMTTTCTPKRPRNQRIRNPKMPYTPSTYQ
ncbi:PREDICTED: uncharacterized protein LOC109473477 [Branchiostoma belcheri]|uniref:Uncharacterized protein LOC109473477 n=1 Tax=Branchiostoma belcheri TaxID=7741 RepID=A0A6P4YX81_BRABE|nr:PREDICTED: uncharacterized protein LOC109473477 [Branchiostoma belcheri]